jgi:hypothetical protein
MNKYPMWGIYSSLAYLGVARSAVLDENALTTERIAGIKWTWTALGWERVDNSMARVRLVSEWRVSTDVPRDLDTIDIARVALVDASPGATAAPPGSARLVDERPGRLRIETAAPEGQLLVVAERFHRGWTAQVDGAPADVRRVYGDYLGCVVPAGAHTVAFVFAPASARYGLWLTLAGLLFTAAGAMVLFRSNRVRHTAAGSEADRSGLEPRS